MARPHTKAGLQPEPSRGRAARPGCVPQPKATAGRADSLPADKSLGKRALDTQLTVLDMNFLHRHFRIWAFPSPYPQVHTCYSIIFRKQMKIVMTPQELSK